LLLDDLDYLNEDSINIFMKGKCKTLSGCNFYGNEEIYLSQVMGVLPDVLFEDWHDNYIDKNHSIYFSEFTFSPAGGNQTFDMNIEIDMSKTWI
jgi:hypothetical protein